MKYSVCAAVVMLSALCLSAQPSVRIEPAPVSVQAEGASALDVLKGSGDVFRLSLEADLPLLIGGAVFAGGIYLTDYLLDPVFPSSVNRNDVNKLDWSMARPYNRPLDITADVIMSLSMAMPAVLFSLHYAEWTTFLTMYLESVMWAFGFNTLIKTFVVRARPYMYFPGAPGNTFESGDQYKSLPSRHTTMAFTGAVFASYVFCKYYPDSVWKYPVVIGSALLAAGTGALRILSGNHFFTDVLTGAAIGGFCGFLVPFLHTLNTGIARSMGYDDESESPVVFKTLPAGLAVSVRW